MKYKRWRFLDFHIFASVIILGGLLILFMTYLFYVHLRKERGVFLQRNSKAIYTSIRDTLDREIYGIAMGFTWWEKTKEAVKKEDKGFFDTQAKDMLNGREWVGMVVVKGDKVIYKKGIYPDIDYPFLVPLKSPIPKEVYTFEKDGKFLGVASFSVCGDNGGDCLKNAAFIGVFDWDPFINRYESFFNMFFIRIQKERPKNCLTCIPLKNYKGEPEAFLVFIKAPWRIGEYTKIFFLLSFLLISMLIFFVLFYFLRQHGLIEKIGEELGFSSERKNFPLLLRNWYRYGRKDDLEAIIERIFGIVAIHRTYRDTLEMAIRTKDLRETLRVLANKLKEEFSAKYWSIVLTPDDISEWKYLLWSDNLDKRCLKELLDLMKKYSHERIDKIKKEKKVLLIESVNNEEAWVETPCTKRYNIVSSTHIPMIVHGKVIGILSLDWDRKKIFSEKERIILKEVKEFITRILEDTYDIQDMFWLSYRDPLTGLYNRRIIDEISQNNGEINYVLFIDVDNFKQVNDRYGHAKGDEVLKKIGKILQDTVREDDIIIRYGGDEFVVCLKDAKREHVERVKERIEKTVTDKFSDLGISVTVGITEVGPDESLKDAIKRADMHMYMLRREKK